MKSDEVVSLEAESVEDLKFEKEKNVDIWLWI